MAISSLPKENKANLIELSSDLEDVLSEKETVIEDSKKLVERMKEIEEVQKELDDKSSKIVDIETPKEAREFQELISKADELSTEKNDIYNESIIINKRLNELNNVENNIKNEINLLLKNENILVNDGINVINRQIPNRIDKIDKDYTKIINSSLTLSNYITDLSNNYLENNYNTSFDADYNQLKEKVERYETIKKDSPDELKLVEKEVSSKQVLNEEESKQEVIQPKEEPIVNTVLEENSEELKNSNVIELPKQNVEQSSINDNNAVNVQEQQLFQEQPKQETIIPLSTVINPKALKLKEKVIPNKIARATKKKIKEVIMPKFSGTFTEKKVITNFEANTNSQSESFNLENFINNKAA